MPDPTVETSAGGIVFRLTDSGPRVLLIRDRYGNWGFPKGHVKTDEPLEAAAVREIAEETTLTDVKLHRPLGVIDWLFRSEGRSIHKFCHYFLCESDSGAASPQKNEGISECAWLTPQDSLDRATFDNARDILRAALRQVEQIVRSRSGQTVV